VFATDYRALVTELVTGRIDLAWLGPLAMLRAGSDAVPVLVMRRADRETFHGALIARRDRGIANIAGLAGRSIGWVDGDSAAGHVFPRALIAAEHGDVDAFLGAQRTLGSHRAVVEAVLDGAVDTGATFVNFDDDGEIAVASWYEHAGEQRDEIVSIAHTPAIPHDMIAVRATLPAGDRDAMVAALCGLVDDHEGQDLQMSAFNGAQGFRPVDPTRLPTLDALARSAGWLP
jgi:phosphate/phosphite/phosphonate ABC transporter binding protein